MINPAAAHHLAIQTQPSDTATAGVAFVQQPVIRLEDQFGNLRSADTGTAVTAARNAGTGTLQGSLTVASVNGVVSFTNLSHNVATTITIGFSSAGLAGATSDSIVVSPAAADHLAIQTQPSMTATGGVACAQQPVIRIRSEEGRVGKEGRSREVPDH